MDILLLMLLDIRYIGLISMVVYYNCYIGICIIIMSIFYINVFN